MSDCVVLPCFLEVAAFLVEFGRERTGIYNENLFNYHE